jgi:hypothetical protein
MTDIQTLTNQVKSLIGEAIRNPDFTSLDPQDNLSAVIAYHFRDLIQSLETQLAEALDQLRVREGQAKALRDREFTVLRKGQQVVYLHQQLLLDVDAIIAGGTFTRTKAELIRNRLAQALILRPNTAGQVRQG